MRKLFDRFLTTPVRVVGYLIVVAGIIQCSFIETNVTAFVLLFAGIIVICIADALSNAIHKIGAKSKRPKHNVRDLEK